MSTARLSLVSIFVQSKAYERTFLNCSKSHSWLSPGQCPGKSVDCWLLTVSTPTLSFCTICQKNISAETGSRSYLSLKQLVCTWNRHFGGCGARFCGLGGELRLDDCLRNFFRDGAKTRPPLRPIGSSVILCIIDTGRTELPSNATPPTPSAHPLTPQKGIAGLNHPQCPSLWRVMPARPPNGCARRPDPPWPTAHPDYDPLPAACRPRAHATTLMCRTSRARV